MQLLDMTKSGVFCRAMLALGVSSCALMSHQAQAQDAAAAQESSVDEAVAPNEIIVSATRRDTSVQDTPVAVSVTTGEIVEKYNISDVQSLTRLEPSLVVNNQGASSNQFIIRGIVSDIGNTTGFYLDEQPLLGAAGSESKGDGTPGLRLHDIERVEVLKGPQGTLFGSGSMAGTLRIITNKPDTDAFAGGGAASIASIKGGNMLFKADGFVNIPLGDQVAVRAVGWTENGGGYIDHKISTLDGTSSTTTEDVNDREVWGGRLSVLLEPTPELSILLQGTGQVVEVDDVQYWTEDAGPYTSTSPTVSPSKDEYISFSATINYDTGVGTVSLIGSYGKQTAKAGLDSTQTGLTLASAFNLQPFKTVLEQDVRYHDYTGEIRFSSAFDGPFQIVTGAYYQSDKAQDTLSAIRANDVTGINACRTLEQCEAMGLREPGFSAPGVPRPDFIYQTVFQRRVKQWAVYAQGDFEVTPELTATAGIRYYKAKIADDGLQVQDIAGPPDFVVPVPVPSWAANGLITDPYVVQNDRSTESSPSYNFSLMWEATPDVSLFARVASGFRVGGNNNAEQLANQAGIIILPSFESDDLWSYEFGTKIYLAGRDLFLDAAVYQMDWSNQQVSASDPSGAFEYVVNAGKTRIRGAELRMTYSSGGFTAGGGVTYTDAKLAEDLSAEVLAAGTIGFEGDRLPRVPRWTFSGQAAYETEISSSASAYIQGDVSYRSGSTSSFNDLNAFNTSLPGFLLAGASVGVRTGPFDVGVFVENITNKAGRYGVDPILDGIRIFSPDPRTFGLRVRAGF
jgi:iron complex outermembrane receptor protein